MSRLQSWFNHCVELWKATKPKSEQQLSEIAAGLDKELGPWAEGSRSEALKHYVRLGSRTALGSGQAEPGTPEHQAFLFAKDLRRASRRQSTRHAVQVSGDTLAGKIDQVHIDHYAPKWASHNTILENVPRGKAVSVDGADARVLSGKSPGTAKPQQFRANLVHARMRHMKQAQVDPIASMDDLNLIHTGVERAINAGKVSDAGANRYHVMRAAMRIVHDQHHDPDYPSALPFKPSYAAMDTEALKVMHMGVQHLDDQGFGEAKQRLTPVLASAVEAHTATPFRPRSARRANTGKNLTISVGYPDLHTIGSDPHRRQANADRHFSTTVDRSRSISPRPETPAPAAAPKPIGASESVGEGSNAGPTSYEDYARRREAGESFSDKVHLEMAKLRRMTKAFETTAGTTMLLKSWKTWRGGDV